MNPIYFFLGVIITIVIGNSFIIFAESDSKFIYSNWILIINSLIAVGLSAMILIKDKDTGPTYQFMLNQHFLLYDDFVQYYHCHTILLFPRFHKVVTGLKWVLFRHMILHIHLQH